MGSTQKLYIHNFLQKVRGLRHVTPKVLAYDQIFLKPA